MKTLIIDSHKGAETNTNLHFNNSKILRDALGADLIWSYEGVNNDLKTGYDAIIFVHSSAYSFIDDCWLTENPNAELFFITNEYNLGEPLNLWKFAKLGRKYTVIANHPPEASKVVTKYTKGWHSVNLNSLCIKDDLDINQARRRSNLSAFLGKKDNVGSILYWGSYRKGRETYFQKYFNSPLVAVSTHSKNRAKFKALGVKPNYCDRVDWNNPRISQTHSLYIEDEKTHKHYNHLANRFYESLNCGMSPIFDLSCRNTIQRSGYPIPNEAIVSSTKDLEDALDFTCDLGWLVKIAQEEKIDTVENIRYIIEHTN